MRVLIIAFGSYGDVLPLVALGSELKRRGHDVILGSAAPFASAAMRAGLEFHQFGTEEDYRQALEHPDLWRPIKGVKRLFAYVERSIMPVHEFIAASRRTKGGTIVIASSLAIGARVAQDALKVPTITVHLSPLPLQSRYEPARLPGVPEIGTMSPRLEWEFQLGVDEWCVDPQITPQLNKMREELGLPPVKRLRHWWNSPRRVLLMCPEWFAAPQPDWPAQLRQTGFPKADRFGGQGTADPAIEAFLAAGDKPVAITFGTALTHGERLYRAGVAAARKLGRRALVLSPAPIDLPNPDAGDVLQVRYAPFGAVLPRCAAFVHHGGVGTLAQAFASGTPQLIVPIAFDQFDNAARVQKIGCGASVHRYLFRAGRGVAALRRILESSEISDACARVATLAAAEDGTTQAADEVEATLEAIRTARRERARA